MADGVEKFGDVGESRPAGADFDVEVAVSERYTEGPVYSPTSR